MDLQAQTFNAQTQPPDPNPLLDSTNDSTLFIDDPDSSCSTPYVSAPSSPGRGGPVNGGFFYSCPASPMHFAISSAAMISSSVSNVSSPESNDFEFSARFGSSGSGQGGSMSSADELFLNGQIRPMKLSTHLERPQVLAPLLDLENEEDDDIEEVHLSSRGRDLRLKNKSLRRRTRSLSPLRTTSFDLVCGGEEEDDDRGGSRSNGKNGSNGSRGEEVDEGGKRNEEEEEAAATATTTPSVSASSSRSSSAGRNSKRWVFLKDFLYRSKSEGRSNNKFWSNISFSPSAAKDKKFTLNFHLSKDKGSGTNSTNFTTGGVGAQKEKGKGVGNGNNNSSKPVNGLGKRRVPTSPHELHYKASRAQAEELRKKTFLPYRQGLLGCLGFSSKSYGAMNGFARALNPVSSR